MIFTQRALESCTQRLQVAEMELNDSQQRMISTDGKTGEEKEYIHGEGKKEPNDAVGGKNDIREDLRQ